MPQKYIFYFSALCLSLVGPLFAEVPTQALSFDTDIKIFDATSSQISKIRRAEEHIKRVVATQEFKDAVINHTYNGVKRFVDNNGLTNAQIYQKILDGAETLNGLKNNTMDLEVEMYYENSNTVGYTMTGSKRIWANTKYYNNYTSVDVTGNLMHEWLHKLGFKHAVSYSRSRDFSVPYAIGDIMVRLAGTDVGYITAVQNLTLSEGSGSVTLKWDPAVSAAGIDEYKVYRRLDGSSTIYLQTTTTSLAYTQSKPSKGATYYVRAYDNNGRTAKSPEIRYDVILKAPTDLSLSQGSTSVTLRWSPATSSGGVDEYRVYRQLDGSSTVYYQGSTTGLSYTQSKPSKGATYYIRAVDNGGQTAKSNTVRLKAITAPTNLTLSKTTTSVVLNWDAGTALAGVKEYRIYRRLSTSSTIYLQATTTGLSYTQARPSSNATYYVRTVDRPGATAKSAEVLFIR